jgi:hypothetical protein
MIDLVKRLSFYYVYTFRLQYLIDISKDSLHKFVNANNLTTMPKHGIHDYSFSIELVAYVIFN